MNVNSLFANGDKRRPGIGPTAGIEILDAIFLDMHRSVRVPTEYAAGLPESGM